MKHIDYFFAKLSICRLRAFYFLFNLLPKRFVLEGAMCVSASYIRQGDMSTEEYEKMQWYIKNVMRHYSQVHRLN